MRETLRGTAAVVSGEIKGKTANLAGEMVSKTANIAGEMVSKTTQFKEALKTSLTSLGSRPQATSTGFQLMLQQINIALVSASLFPLHVYCQSRFFSTKIDADVAEDDCTESTDVLAPLQSPSKHRQARTSPRGNAYPSLWSDVDRFLPSDLSPSDLSPDDSTPPHPTDTDAAAADQSEPLISPDQFPVSLTHPSTQVPEMNGPDHPKLEGVDSVGEGFVVPRLGHEEHGEEGKKGQVKGESRRAQEEEFSMNLWLMGSSNGGSSTTSSTAGWFPASSSQTQVTLAAPGCVLAPSWSISGFSNTQSQGDAAGKEREGRSGAEAGVGGGGRSTGEEEGGDDAAEGWHPTPPAVVQSPFGVSAHVEEPEPGQAEACGDMDRVWEELYVQRECESQPSSPKESRGALPAIKRLLVVRRESVQRSDSRDSVASTDSRGSISRHATVGSEGWQQLEIGGAAGCEEWKADSSGSSRPGAATAALSSPAGGAIFSAHELRAPRSILSVNTVASVKAVASVEAVSSVTAVPSVEQSSAMEAVPSAKAVPTISADASANAVPSVNAVSSVEAVISAEAVASVNTAA
ncbi:unnamed protein product [Closterium sp. Naga37s-1]|nr:unnamed protein product [Closterium sp. Naga37s-1]